MMEEKATILQRLQAEKRYAEAAIEVVSLFPVNWERNFCEIPSEVIVAVEQIIEDMVEEDTMNIDDDTPLGNYLHKLPLYGSLISFGIAWGRLYPSPKNK